MALDLYPFPSRMNTAIVEQSIGNPHVVASERTARLRSILLRSWRTPGVNELLRATVPYTPAPLRRWIEQERARVREHELRTRILNRRRLVPEKDLRHLLRRGLRALMDRNGRDLLGDYLEFGVYHGTSLACMYRELMALDLQGVRLFGFDSFRGFPPGAADEDEGRWQPGRCCSPLELTTAVLESEGVDLARVTLVPGWFADTLNPATVEDHRITKASVIMIDCDLYSSAKEALAFCAPLIHDDALVLFDEWTITRLPNRMIGERKAFHEFLRQQRCFSAVPFGQYADRSQAFLVSRAR